MRTILSLTQESGSPDAILQLEDTTITVAGDWKALRIDAALCEPPDWGAPGAVRERGRALREFLGHEASLDNLLTAIQGLAPGSHQLYFRHKAAAAESIDWETLYEQRDGDGQFLALASCPIGRVTRLPLRNSGPHTIPKPLRLMAIVSALGESGVDEYAALRAAVDAANAAGAEVVLRVLTGEPAILDAPDADPAIVGPLPGVPGDVRSLQAAVGDFDPHVLHVFAHGVAEAGSGKKWLEFGLRPDWEDEEATAGSLQLHEEQLANLLQARSTWLVVLNCCNGSRAVETGPLARRLVEMAKVAAVIGMVAPIDPTDATTFTRGFYPGLFAAVRALLEGMKGSIDWAELLVKPRRDILDANGGQPDNVRSWSLPVVYAVCAPYTPLWYSLSLPQILQLEVARSAVASLNLGPKQKRELIRQLLEGSIDEQYWPGPNGELPEGVL